MGPNGVGDGACSTTGTNRCVKPTDPAGMVVWNEAARRTWLAE